MPDSTATRVVDFIRTLAFEQVPEAIGWEAVRCLLDTLGVAAGGAATSMSVIARNHAAEAFGAGSVPSRMLFDGRQVSVVGAAMAGAATIDSLDAHDGHVLTKGHAGAALVPALLAFADREPDRANGQELLTSLIVGYEVSTRAGIALHRTASRYHTSGAWNALGCAAVGSRWLGLDAATISEALGIAEYHGPRSEMMRCIESPTMVKDGSMWGAAAGVGAALLARSGFTGAPAVTVIGEDVQDLWSDLGERWYVAEQYLKPHAVCRWAQPSVQAVIDVMQSHGIPESDVDGVQVATFDAAVKLATRHPATTEHAQYSLPFSVANAIVYGDVPVSELLEPQHCGPRVSHWLDAVEVVENEDFTARFPAERLALTTVRLRDGSQVRSEVTAARGGAESPLTDQEVFEKFRLLSGDAIGEERTERIVHAVVSLIEGAGDLSRLFDDVFMPAGEHVPVGTARAGC